MINARINANGNSRNDFVRAGLALADVETAINNAMSVLATNVLHGRNYPHAEAGGCTRAAFNDREAVLAKLTAAIDASRDVQHALMGVINGKD